MAEVYSMRSWITKQRYELILVSVLISTDVTCLSAAFATIKAYDLGDVIAYKLIVSKEFLSAALSQGGLLFPVCSCVRIIVLMRVYLCSEIKLWIVEITKIKE